MLRSVLPAGKTGKVVTWMVEPHAIEGWIREPNIGFSQVGYMPQLPKVAVIELDKNDPAQTGTARLLRIGDDVTHGAGLAAVWPSWARYVMHQNLSRFVRFAVNVMQVPNDFIDPEATALRGIEAMERFYHAIGMPVNIKELIGRDITDEEIQEMVRKSSRDYTATCGALKVLNAQDMEQIYKMARG